MGKQYKRIVNKPQKAMKRAFDEVVNWTPENNWWQLLRMPGETLTFSAYILTWLLTRIGFDNPIIDKLADKNSKKKLKSSPRNKFDKAVNAITKLKNKYPTPSAMLVYYMMLAALLAGGKVTTDIIQNVIEQQDDDDENFEPGTYGVYFDKIRTITPFLIADLIAKEGVHTDKNGMHVPYKDSRGIWTIGFGSTVLKDGTRVTPNTKPMTDEEAYELARWHLEDGETYFCMYCYDVAYNTIDINDVNQAFAMGSIIYNSFSKLIEKPDNKNCEKRFAMLRDLYKEYGRGLTDQMVQDAFAKYPVTEPTSFGSAWLGGQARANVADKLGGFLAGGRGLYWRRWLEAGLLTGDITPQMLLDCPANGVYEFFKCVGGEKESFFTKDIKGNMHVNRKTYDKFIEWLKNPVNEKGKSLARWHTVRDYMPQFALEACDGKVCELGAKASKKQRVHQKEVERETYVLDYASAYESALMAYKAGDFGSAASQFEVLVANNPNNALLHNDLAATYNKLGRYDDAISHAKEIVYKIGDKSQYAAAQYNAGFAYEQKGDLEKALANYKLSVANGNRRVQSDVTRVKNMMTKSHTKSKVAVFNNAAAQIGSRIKNVKKSDVAQIGADIDSRV